MMVKSKKQRTAGFWTVSRARMVETMTAHGTKPPGIATALGCSTEMVVDFLLGQVGTEHEATDDRLFYMVAMASGKETSMASGYHVYVTPIDAPKAKEWVTQAKDADEASDFRKYLQPKLPEGLVASSEWGTKSADVPTFDQRRLREPANVPKDAPKGE